MSENTQPAQPARSGRSLSLTVVGGGVAGLAAAITAAEDGARVTLHEAHRTLGGRLRTADAPYRTHDGPHVIYRGGAHWTWLRQRGLVGRHVAIPPGAAVRMRFHLDGKLRRVPPLSLLRLSRVPGHHAPVDRDFLSWASERAGARTARLAARFAAVALFHHDPGALSAAFVQERLHQAAGLPPEARYVVDGWGGVVERMAAYARSLGVRVETGSRIEPGERAASGARGAWALRERTGGPVVVATTLAAARPLLDAELPSTSGRTALLDLALRKRPGHQDLFVVSDLDAPGWLERFTAPRVEGFAPPGEELFQGQFPLAPGEDTADGLARAERLLDLGVPHWRERVTWRREALANGRTGALDLPGRSWRDRPAIDRGGEVYLAGDEVAAPGLLSEVSFLSGIEAATLALSRVRDGSRSRAAVPQDAHGKTAVPQDAHEKAAVPQDAHGKAAVPQGTHGEAADSGRP